MARVSLYKYRLRYLSTLHYLDLPIGTPACLKHEIFFVKHNGTRYVLSLSLKGRIPNSPDCEYTSFVFAGSTEWNSWLSLLWLVWLVWLVWLAQVIVAYVTISVSCFFCSFVHFFCTFILYIILWFNVPCFFQCSHKQPATSFGLTSLITIVQIHPPRNGHCVGLESQWADFRWCGKYPFLVLFVLNHKHRTFGHNDINFLSLQKIVF